MESVSLQGDRVRIESFSRVEVLREGPCWESGCRVTSLLQLDQPLEARLLPDGVEISGRDDRTHERDVKLVPLDRGRTWARLSERSTSRGFIIGGVATASALLAGIGAAEIVRSRSGSRDDLRVLGPLLAGTGAGAATGGLSILVTFPLTKDLGTEH